MKATDRELINISEELTAHIITPKGNLNLSRDECIILNRLISEKFERRQEQDAMDVVYRQDPSLGQTGDNHNDDALNASERRDSEVSGVEVRKKKPQITKVSKKEYWENFENRGRWNPKKWYNTHYVKPKIYPFDSKLFKEQGVKIVDGLRVKEEKGEGDKKYPAPPKSDTTITRPVQKVEINTNETSDEITQLDDLKDTEEINSEIKVSKGAMSIDVYKLFGHSFDDKSLNFGGMPLLDKYIPIAWVEERIRVNKKFPCSTLFEGYDAVYQSVIDSWKAFGRDDWYKDVHDESC